MRIVLILLLSMPWLATASERTPADAVSALWRALSNDPGGSADIGTLRRLFHEDAVVFGGRYKDGAPVLRRSTASEFLGPYERPSEKGFYECEVHRSLKVYDRFAVAYSVVESRADKAAVKPDFVGVNSIQLYRVGSQWQILSLYYHAGKPDFDIPLDGGSSGKCLG